MIDIKAAELQLRSSDYGSNPQVYLDKFFDVVYITAKGFRADMREITNLIKIWKDAHDFIIATVNTVDEFIAWCTEYNIEEESTDWLSQVADLYFKYGFLIQIVASKQTDAYVEMSLIALENERQNLMKWKQLMSDLPSVPIGDGYGAVVTYRCYFADNES